MNSSNVDTQAEGIGSSFTKPSASMSNSQSGEEREDFEVLMDNVADAVSDYCRQRPGVAAGLLFAVGFFVGWRLKPW